MPDTYTANLRMILPEVGASRDSWGAKQNANLQQLDTVLYASMPVGALLDYAGATPPAGWIACDGLQYLITAYPALFAVIGNRYGGDGTTYFAVPDLRARSAAGVGYGVDNNGVQLGYSLAQKWGYYYQYITRANLPNYVLPESSDGNHQHSANAVTDAQGDHQHAGYTDAPGDHVHGYTITNFGNGNWVQGASGTQMYQGGSNTTPAGNHSHNIITDVRGAHQHNVGVVTYAGQGGHYHSPVLGGSGQLFWTTSPILAVTKMIFAGPPPTPGAMKLQQQAQPLAMMTPLRGMH
jgi:microcystin-dependent protein